ncbi:hypothetical protein RU820_05065 [Acidithiobacillus ferrooxidans]|uniref:Uncharacterized protein n=1 Tax=Acidithiobacillus ferrooxidans (strain ATCC 23270 / DSM 14882 / CIP 104768 / NCIMB 8455) TaxID=243159 RepID=B7J817_ACIF2|nr:MULTISPECIES: hypothetical protein [Acidithiobacillus]ACK80784.1 hypothetical protein AFE_1069 [Acidithiobacillus ferrooxidans ATCC 23270]MBN6744936.1 hypothetical protein [Acidithiobacillus sp. MC2.2]MBN6747880.1 hypothetical protein [Acidithiobacillus sp. PG05]
MQNGKMIRFLRRFEYRDVAILAEEAVFYVFGLLMIAVASGGMHRWLFLGAFLAGVPAGMVVTYVYNRIVSSRFHRDMPGYAWFGYPMGLGFLLLALQACGDSLLPAAIMAVVCGFVLLMGLLTISNEEAAVGVGCEFNEFDDWFKEMRDNNLGLTTGIPIGKWWFLHDD